MNNIAAQLFKADIVDPTNDGILLRIIQFGISALMLLAVLLGAWFAFQAWTSASGKGDQKSVVGVRNVVFGVIIIEAVLGGILVLARYGADLLPSLGVI